MNIKKLIFFFCVSLAALQFSLALCTETDSYDSVNDFGTTTVDGHDFSDYCVDSDGDLFFESVHEYYCFNSAELKELEDDCMLGCGGGACRTLNAKRGGLVVSLPDEELSIQNLNVTIENSEDIYAAEIDTSGRRAVFYDLPFDEYILKVSSIGYEDLRKVINLDAMTIFMLAVTMEKTVLPEADCSTDKDCDDSDPNTKDSCVGNPGSCTNERAATCGTDGTCPPVCSYPQDVDCDECISDEICDDFNPCTADTCSGEPKRCINTDTKTGCPGDEGCIPYGPMGNDYCGTDGQMYEKKTIGEECSQDYECMDGRCRKSICDSPGFIENLFDWLKRLF